MVVIGSIRNDFFFTLMILHIGNQETCRLKLLHILLPEMIEYAFQLITIITGQRQYFFYFSRIGTAGHDNYQYTRQKECLFHAFKY